MCYTINLTILTTTHYQEVKIMNIPRRTAILKIKKPTFVYIKLRNP